MATAARRCGWLTLATFGFWVLLAWPAYRLAGVRGLEGMSTAAALCLVPGWFVFWLVFWSTSRYGVTQSRALAVLAGTVLRLLFVLIGTVVVQSARGLGFWEFLVWLVVFYVVTLVVETILVLKPAA